MTLREICETLGVSRRALQGYEKAGLVASTGRNKYGHLLYDEKARERIAEIKFYQQLGFSIKEISDIIDASTAVMEFLDKTNLLKGSLAGLATAGAIKGFTTIATGIKINI